MLKECIFAIFLRKFSKNFKNSPASGVLRPPRTIHKAYLQKCSPWTKILATPMGLSWFIGENKEDRMGPDERQATTK